MLNAKELVKAVKEAKPNQAHDDIEDKPVRKLLDWDGKVGDPEEAALVSSMLAPLGQPRLGVRSSLSQGEWDEARRRVVITRNCGRAELGPALPEEALYLVCNGSLAVTRAGAPLSLQTAFSLLLAPATGLTPGAAAAQDTPSEADSLFHFRDVPGLLEVNKRWI